MKVLIGATAGSTSGIETYTRHLADALVEAGHEVVLLDRSRGPREGAADDNGCLRRIPLRPEPTRLRRLVIPVEAKSLHRRIRRILREEEPDAFHATQLPLVPARAKRVVVTAWDPQPFALRRAAAARGRGERVWRAFLFALMDHSACRRASSIMAVTKEVERGLRSRYDAVQWLPPFLPDHAVRPPASARSRDCVMIANHLDAPLKNLPLAVEAVREVRRRSPRTRLILVGGWADESVRRALPDFCLAPGRMQQGELAELLAGAGCCLLPSLWEEFGYAGLEALAAGTPLVCSPALPGFRDLDTKGVVIARSDDPVGFGSAAADALALERFDFPAPCRASHAIPRLLDAYEHA